MFMPPYILNICIPLTTSQFIITIFMFSANPRSMLTLTSFKSIESGQALFDFSTPLNQQNFILNDTSLVFRKKADSEVSFRNLTVVSKQKAMDGDMPDF